MFHNFVLVAFVALAAGAIAVVQQGNVFPGGVQLSDGSSSSPSSCDSAGIVRFIDGQLHTCNGSSFVPSFPAAPVAFQTDDCVASLGLLNQLVTIHTNEYNKLLDIESQLSAQAGLLSPASLQRNLFCSGHGTYNANTDACTCDSNSEVGFYVGTRCFDCESGMDVDEASGLCTKDVLPPTISLIGDAEVFLFLNQSYTDDGVTVSDNRHSESELLASYLTSWTNLSIVAVGRYVHEYTVRDAANNTDSVYRVIHVVERAGLSSGHPGASCKQLRDEDISNTGIVRPSGPYWIQPHPSESPYQVYCDMVTDGGGWTLYMKMQSSIQDQYETGTLNPTVLSDISTISFGKLSDTLYNAINPDEVWSMCGGHQSVAVRNKGVTYYSNHGASETCGYTRNFFTGNRQTPGGSVSSFSSHNGACGGGQVSGQWAILTGIHYPDNKYYGCYNPGDGAGTSVVTNPLYTTPMGSCDTWNTGSIGCQGFSFLR